VTSNELTNTLLLEIPKRFPQCRVWRANSATAFPLDRAKAALRYLLQNNIKAAIECLRSRPIRFGVPGQADISGVAGPAGRRLEIEVKVGTDKLRPEQVAFRKMCLDRGAVYIEARDVETALKELEVELGTL
jgi:hypothetical protein